MPPRRRTALTERQRYRIAKDGASNPALRHAQLVQWASEQLGVTVDRTAVTKLLKRKDLLSKDERDLSDLKKSRPLQCPKLDEALHRWFLYYQNKVAISDHILLEKARELAF